MAILMPNDTARVLGAKAEKCESRSLLMDRFADPEAREDDRRAWFSEVLKKNPVTIERPHLTSAGWPAPVFAQLQSRLMVNMAGGVMENAGLCLDRYGLPYIPGSAVKGCARRAALAALREWCQTGTRPGDEEGGESNLLKPACAGFNSPLDMLVGIARVFGWTDVEWSDDRDKKSGRYKSDFLWATMAPEGGDLRRDAVFRLAESLGVSLKLDSSAPWKDLPSFAGSVAFLAAHAVKVSDSGGLELDVVTCHHRKYYDDREMARADDTEEPVPVIFPAVAAGQNFAFQLAPLRDSDGNLTKFSNKWLVTGLETFGLGAKTAAGYGWFTLLTEATPTGASSSVEESASKPAALSADYNETSFRNAVLKRLDQPQDYQQLQQEILKLQKEANVEWRQKMRDYLASRDGKDARNRLRQKDWFPKEWLPA